MGSVFSACRHKDDVNELAHSSPVASTRPSPDLQQPELDPAAWLLSAGEISAFRGGVPRADMQKSSQGNDVKLFSCSAEGFAAMYADMEAAASGDTKEDEAWIWIAGWALDPKVPLIATGSKAEAEATSLENTLKRAVRERGVHVRMLLWANLFETDDIVKARDCINAIAPPSSVTSNAMKGSCVCVFDDRLPHQTSAHHQKMVIVKRQGHRQLIAHVGGLDITSDRWDTLGHDQMALRRERGVFKESDGWLDASVRLEGLAAQDVAATFCSRWNSKKKPCVDMDDKVLKFLNPENVRNLEPLLGPSKGDDVLKSPSTAHIQIVRTFSPHKAAELYPEFAPKGELSLLHSRVKAIHQARNFIYIEDQYFFYMPQLLDALVAVLPRLLRVIVVVQRPTSSTQARVAGYEKLVFQMARPLQAQFPDKFRIYTTREDRNLYIHTKVLLVDDVFVSIGSCNWNRRSTTSDSEIAANVVDTETTISVPSSQTNNNSQENQIHVGQLVRRFRLQKFVEKLGVDSSKVDMTVAELDKLGLVESCELLEKAARDPSATAGGLALLDVLAVDDKWEFAVFPATYTLVVVDPDDLNDETDP